MTIKLLHEIIRRKKAGSMKFTISEEKSKSYEKFFNNLKKYLSSEEINILIKKSKDENKINEKKDLRRPFSLQHHYWTKKSEKKLLDHYDINLDIGNPNRFWKFSVSENPIENIYRQEILSHHYCDDFRYFYLNKRISPSDSLWIGNNESTENCDMIIKLINKGSYIIKKLNSSYQITFYSE